MDNLSNDSSRFGRIRTLANGMNLGPAGTYPPGSPPVSTLCPLSMQVGMELALLSVRAHRPETVITPSAPQLHPGRHEDPPIAASEESRQFGAHREELSLNRPTRVQGSTLSPSQHPVGPNGFELSRGGGLSDLENFLTGRREAVTSAVEVTDSNWQQLLGAYGFPNRQSSLVVEQLLRRAIQSTRRIDPMLERRQALAPSAFLNNIILGVCLEHTVAVASDGEPREPSTALQPGGGTLPANRFLFFPDSDSRRSRGGAATALEAEPMAEQMRTPGRISSSSRSSGSNGSSSHTQQFLQQSGATHPLATEEQRLTSLRSSGRSPSTVPPPTATVDPASEGQEGRRGENENIAPMDANLPSSGGDTEGQRVGGGPTVASFEAAAQRRNLLARANGRGPLATNFAASAPAQRPGSFCAISLSELDWNSVPHLAYLGHRGRVTNLSEAQTLPPETGEVSAHRYEMQQMRTGAHTDAAVAAGAAAEANNRDEPEQYNGWETASDDAPFGGEELSIDFGSETESETTWGSATDVSSDDTMETSEGPLDDDLEGVSCSAPGEAPGLAPFAGSDSLANVVLDIQEVAVFGDVSDSEGDSESESESEADFDVDLQGEPGAEANARDAVAAGDTGSNGTRHAETNSTETPLRQENALNDRLSEQELPSGSLFALHSRAPPHNFVPSEGFPSRLPSSPWALEHEGASSEDPRGAPSDDTHLQQHAAARQREEQERPQQLEQQPPHYNHLSPMSHQEDAQSSSPAEQQQAHRPPAELNSAEENTAATTSLQTVLGPPTLGREMALPVEGPLTRPQGADELRLHHQSAPPMHATRRDGDSDESHPPASTTRDPLTPPSQASEGVTTYEIPYAFRVLRDPANAGAAQMFWDTVTSPSRPSANTAHSSSTPTREALEENRQNAEILLHLLCGPGFRPPFGEPREAGRGEGSAEGQSEHGVEPASSDNLQDASEEDKDSAELPPAQADTADRGGTSAAQADTAERGGTSVAQADIERRGGTSTTETASGADSLGGNTEAVELQRTLGIQQQEVYQLIHRTGTVVEGLGRRMNQLLDMMEVIVKRDINRN
ncbi:hypothetical protein, conserved [Eimeria brunetti]|uniref:Uncharacterized protein n=1 Tax=Eimeria brunetti TaxID=51314 RepID=U6LR81_9EIME|nr:hypothetical protein, conserved [Eimeria brunetti]